MKQSAHDFSRIIRGAKKGKQRDIESLYHATEHLAYSVAVSYVGNADAPDVVQESFIKAIRALDTFDESRNFTTWYRTIVANQAKDVLKKKRPMLFEDDETLDTFNDLSPLPVELLEREEKRREIMRIVESLPAGQRAVVTMYYFDELKESEIAEQLGVTVGTIKKQLHEGMKKIEKAVLHEEAKGNKLYGAAAIPALSKVFQNELESGVFKMPAEVSAKVLSGAMQSIGAAGAVGGVAGAASVGAKFLALSAGAKAAVVTVSAAVIVSSVGVPLYIHNEEVRAAEALQIAEQQEQEAQARSDAEQAAKEAAEQAEAERQAQAEEAAQQAEAEEAARQAEAEEEARIAEEAAKAQAVEQQPAKAEPISQAETTVSEPEQSAVTEPLQQSPSQQETTSNENESSSGWQPGNGPEGATGLPSMGPVDETPGGGSNGNPGYKTDEELRNEYVGKPEPSGTKGNNAGAVKRGEAQWDSSIGGWVWEASYGKDIIYPNGGMVTIPN